MLLQGADVAVTFSPIPDEHIREQLGFVLATFSGYNPAR